MTLISRSLLVFVLVFGVITTVTAAAPADQLDDTLTKLDKVSAPDTKAVQWKDIKGWRWMGERWAGALDGESGTAAIYDLSSPELLSRIPFGVIGGKKISKKEIIAMIREAKNEPGTDLARADEAIRDLEQVSGGPIEEGTMPEQWWRDVSWFERGRGEATTEPASFRLSDIDFSTSSKNFKKFQRVIDRTEKTLDDIEEPGFGKNFLKQFEFVHNTGGGYTLFWNPAIAARAGVSRPRKIADLHSPKWGYVRALKVQLLHEALSQAAGLVPIPVVSGLLETAVSRFFHFYTLVDKSEANMLVEALTASQEPTGPFVGFPLTAAERSKAISATIFFQSSIEDSWKWVFGNPQKEWNKNSKRDADYALRSAGWLRDNGVPYVSLNARFAKTESGRGFTPSIVLMARAKASKKHGPHIAVNYANADAIRKARIREEIMTTAVVFGCHFIPDIIPVMGVGGLIEAIYKELVERPVDRSRIWESRLTAVLEDEAKPSADYAAELTILDRQRVNPLFADRQKTTQLIAARKQLLKP